MVLKLSNDLFSNNFFTQTPEDGQVGMYSGNRIIPTDLPVSSDTVTLTPLESALNVLQLQVAAAITPGDYVGVEMDIFSDETGYLNTVDDTSNTTAAFTTNKYTNGNTTGYSKSVSGSGMGYASSLNITCSAVGGGFVSSTMYDLEDAVPGDQNNYTFEIIQGGTTLASKNVLMNNASHSGTLTYVIGDYSSAIIPGTFSIVITRTSGSHRIYTNSLTSSDQGWIITGQTVPSAVGGGAIVFTRIITDCKVQTNVQTLVAGFTHFQVVAFRGAVTGTGTITADISFDNGAHYQTGLAVNTNYSITNVGTQMILKLNLNGTGAGNTAESMGWGVQLW